MNDNRRLFDILILYGIFITLFGLTFFLEIWRNEQLWKVYFFQWFVYFIGVAKLLNDKREENAREKRDRQ